MDVKGTSSDLRFKRIGEGSSHIGLLIHPMDPDRVYLAIPIDCHPGAPLGFFIDADFLEIQEDVEGRKYAAVRWTLDFDRRWISMIDLMIAVRSAHPTMVQLPLFDARMPAL